MSQKLTCVRGVTHVGGGVTSVSERLVSQVLTQHPLMHHQSDAQCHLDGLMTNSVDNGRYSETAGPHGVLDHDTTACSALLVVFSWLH
jgi:hypothetical protein